MNIEERWRDGRRFRGIIEEDGEVDDRVMTTEGKEKMEDWLQERWMDEKQMEECKKDGGMLSGITSEK